MGSPHPPDVEGGFHMTVPSTDALSTGESETKGAVKGLFLKFPQVAFKELERCCLRL